MSLNEEEAKDIVDKVTVDKIVIVCLSAERQIIDRVLNQLGFSHRIQGIITQDDLERWYSKCFSDEYKESLGRSLLNNLVREFREEFPSSGDVLSIFMKERGYDEIELREIFQILT